MKSIAKQSLLLAGIIILGLALTRFAPVAHAANPGCGDTITSSVTLTADIGPCAGDGLVIGADNLVVDCAGHSITGTTPGTNGIYDNGYNGLTVKDCTISGFGDGIHLESVWYGTITGNTVDGNGYIGIGLDDGSFAAQSEYNVISGNTVDDNGIAAGIGLYISSYNTITSNTVDNNANAGIVIGGLGGCSPGGVAYCSIGNDVEGNTADGQKYGIVDQSPNLGVGSGTAGTWNTYYDNECHGNSLYDSYPAGLCGAWTENAPEFPFGPLLLMLTLPCLLVLGKRQLVLTK